MYLLLASEVEVSFLEILADAADLRLDGKCDATHVSQTPTEISKDATFDNSPPINAEDLSLSYQAAREGQQQYDSSHQDMVVDPVIGSDIVNWEAEAFASLNFGWTLQLGDFTSTPYASDPEPQLQTSTDAMMLEGPPPSSSPHTSSASTLGNTNSILSGVTDDTSTSFPTLTNLAALTSEDFCLAGSVQPVSVSASNPSISRITRKPSKRKRLSSMIARKKQHMTTSQPPEMDLGEHLDAYSNTQGELYIALPPGSGALARNSNNNSPPTTTRASRIIKTDWIRDWEKIGYRGTGQDNAGVVRDVNISDRDRRPVSWPRRDHFRKSIDISVAVLAKRFEKKMRSSDDP